MTNVRALAPYRVLAALPEPDLDPIDGQLHPCPYCGYAYAGKRGIWIDGCIRARQRNWLWRIFGAQPIVEDRRLHVHARCNICNGSWKVAQK